MRIYYADANLLGSQHEFPKTREGYDYMMFVQRLLCEVCVCVCVWGGTRSRLQRSFSTTELTSAHMLPNHTFGRIQTMLGQIPQMNLASFYLS